jgi:molybdopterin synthase sulfur carrier subunit
MITVLFFGPVAERVGTSRLDFTFQAGLRLQDVHDALRNQYPDAFSLVSLVAVNGTHEKDFSRELSDHDELVFMSRFSGG